jgi:hypothetical protein
MDDAGRMRNGDLSDGDAAVVGRLILSAQRMASELLADARRQVDDTTALGGSVAVLTGPPPDPSFVARLEEIERRTEEAARELARAEARSIEHLERLQRLLARQRRALEEERADLDGSVGLAQLPTPDPFSAIDSWSDSDTFQGFSGLRLPVGMGGAGDLGVRPAGAVDHSDATNGLLGSGLGEPSDPNASTVAPGEVAETEVATSDSSSVSRGRTKRGSVWTHRLLTGGAGIAILAAAIEVARVL